MAELNPLDAILAPVEEVDIDADDAPTTEPLIYDESATNLVPALSAHPDGKKFLKKLADDIFTECEEALSNSEEYREKRRVTYRLFSGDIPKKEYPFENAANVHVPIVLENILRLSTRTYAEIFSDKTHVFGVMPTGPDDYDSAELLTIHGNWQFRAEITDFPRQQHRGIQEFYTVGSVFCHSYRDIRRNRNRHDILTCDDLIVPYVHVSTEIDMSDCPFKARVHRLYAHEVESYRDEWYGVEEVLAKEPPSWDDEPEAKLREGVAQAQGILVPDDDKKAPYVVYEYAGYSKLPGQDSHRPICAFLDKRTRAVLKLYLREEDDWKDVLRFEREKAEYDDYLARTQQHAALVAQEEALRAALGRPDIDPEEKLIIESGLSAQGPLPEPVPPQWMEHDEMGAPLPPKPVRKVPLEMFSHGVCVENPLGLHGLSYGNILSEFNKAANTAGSQFSDAATMGNSWSIIVPDTLQIDNGTISLAPGAVNRVGGVSGPELRNSIVELKPAPANPQLVELLRMNYDWGQTSVAAPDVLSGEPGKSGETYRGISARIEQATKQLSVSASKYGDFLTNIYRNNGKLNYMFMPDEEVVDVANHLDFTAMRVPVSRDLYRRDYRVTLFADLNFSSKAQRVSEADELVQMPMAVPPLQGNLAYWHYAASQALRARGQHHAIPLLGPPPPLPETPFGLMPPPPPDGGPPSPPQGPPRG